MWRVLLADFGESYVAVVFLFFGLVKGFSGGLMRGLALPYFQDVLHVPLGEYHRIYTAILIFPWCVKPIFGVFSDLVPLGGFRKRWYLRVFGTIIAVSTAYVGISTPDVENHTLALGAAGLGVVAADLLMEASYSESLRDRSALSGNGIVLFAWATCIAGIAIAAIVSGTVADRGFAHETFLAAAPFPLLFAFVANSVPETRSVYSHRKAIRFFGHIILSVGIAGTAIALSLLMFHANINIQVSVLTLCLISVFSIAKHVLPPTLFWCNLYMFFVDALAINYVGATDYFYTSNCAGSPNFSFTFYTTYSMLLSSLFGIVGIALFSCFNHVPIKHLFASLTMVRVVAASLEVIQAARLNKAAGIHDRTFYLLGEAVIHPTVSMLFSIPIILLTSRLVDRGSEAMTYAILAGTQNLGSLVASVAGQWATDMYHLRGCDFNELPGALVFGHMAMPLLCVPLAFLMLPDTTLSRK